MSKYDEDYERLLNLSKFEYGATFDKEALHAEFGILPLEDSDFVGRTAREIVGLVKAHDQEGLSIYGFLAKRLLEDGKYFHQVKSRYRIALVSENQQAAERYLEMSRKKLVKGDKLMRSVPVAVREPSNFNSQMAMQANKIEHMKAKLAPMGG